MEMNGRLNQSPPAVDDAMSRMIVAMDQLVALANDEVRIRAEQLRHCNPENVAYYRERLNRAQQALAISGSVLQRGHGVSSRARALSHEMIAHATQQISRVHAVVQEMANGGGAASTGMRAATAAVIATAGGRTEGALADDASAETCHALREYSRLGRGEGINGRAREKRSTTEDRALMHAIDAGFEGVAPLRADVALHRDVGVSFFGSLCDGARSPEEILTRLNSGAATRDRGYVSTSASGGSFGAKPIHLTVHVPAGTKVIDMTRSHPDGKPLSVFPKEGERLLPRDGHLIGVPGTARYDRVRGTYSLEVDYLHP
jgi:hypothetical protein